MPLSEKTKDRICATVWHITGHNDVEGFKFGITRQGILKRFRPHKKGYDYEHVVALADNLSPEDALDLEKDSIGGRGSTKSLCHSVYIVWYESDDSERRWQATSKTIQKEFTVS